MPHVQRWLRRFRALTAAQPKEVEVLVMSGTISVMALNEHRESFDCRDKGADVEALVSTVPSRMWDGGDW